MGYFLNLIIKFTPYNSRKLVNKKQDSRRSNDKTLNSDQIYSQLLEERRKKLEVKTKKRVKRPRKNSDNVITTDTSTEYVRSRLGSKEVGSSDNSEFGSDKKYRNHILKKPLKRQEFRCFEKPGSYVMHKIIERDSNDLEEMKEQPSV